MRSYRDSLPPHRIAVGLLPRSALNHDMDAGTEGSPRLAYSAEAVASAGKAGSYGVFGAQMGHWLSVFSSLDGTPPAA